MTTPPDSTPAPMPTKVLAAELRHWSVLPLGAGVNQAAFHHIAREAADRLEQLASPALRPESLPEEVRAEITRIIGRYVLPGGPRSQSEIIDFLCDSIRTLWPAPAPSQGKTERPVWPENESSNEGNMCAFISRLNDHITTLEDRIDVLRGAVPKTICVSEPSALAVKAAETAMENWLESNAPESIRGTETAVWLWQKLPQFAAYVAARTFSPVAGKEASADTKRLDWLEKNKPTLLCLVRNDQSGEPKPRETFWEINDRGDFPTARSAIDAAMQREDKKDL